MRVNANIEHACRILVTGAGGFVASHCILQLVEEGFRVRGTLRDMEQASGILQRLRTRTAVPLEQALEFVQADLLRESTWKAAVEGCQGVIHIASPFPLLEPAREQDILIPAVEGTRRVLLASQAAGVRRFIFLSSTAAILGGHEGYNRTFDEADWSRVEANIGAYARSKTLAEQAAWDTVGASPEETELTVLNPPFIYGPLLDDHYFTSSELIRALMAADVPGVAPVRVPFVDVRDVAWALVAAMRTPEAAGQRLSCVGHICWMEEIAAILQAHFGPRGYKIPIRVIPGGVLRLLGIFSPRIRLTIRGLGWHYDLSTNRIEALLGWCPRPAKDTILEMAESMVQQGWV